MEYSYLFPSSTNIVKMTTKHNSCNENSDTIFMDHDVVILFFINYHLSHLVHVPVCSRMVIGSTDVCV